MKGNKHGEVQGIVMENTVVSELKEYVAALEDRAAVTSAAETALANAQGVLMSSKLRERAVLMEIKEVCDIRLEELGSTNTSSATE